jgi:hypothetical protein
MSPENIISPLDPSNTENLVILGFEKALRRMRQSGESILVMREGEIIDIGSNGQELPDNITS